MILKSDNESIYDKEGVYKWHLSDKPMAPPLVVATGVCASSDANLGNKSGVRAMILALAVRSIYQIAIFSPHSSVESP